LSAPTLPRRSPASGARKSSAQATKRQAAKPDFEGAQRFINRELSWLEFDSRVLALAEDRTLPLLERAKFLAIVSQNMDEFFQVRVAGLKEQVGAGVGGTTPPDGMSAHEQLKAIRENVTRLVERQGRVLTDEVMPGLAAAGIHIPNVAELDAEDAAWLRHLFEERIFPVLTPLAVDPAHPFPYISNLSLNLAVLVRDPQRRTTRFARVKVPPLLPRFVEMPGGDRFIPLEQVIAAHLDALFPGMKIVAHHPFRITRNADLELEEDEADDLLAAIESELRKQRRFADIVRLEIDRGMSEETLRLLMRELELEEDDVYVVDGLIDQGSLWMLHALNRPELKSEPWQGTVPARLTAPNGSGPDYFRLLRERDVLLHHPYESFVATTSAFMEQAVRDPNVLAIKQTLYRTSGPEGAIMRSLIRAAEAGKQAVALVELKARGDEQANITWARALEEAGVHVVYGLVGLKTHAKVTLVVRQEGGAIRHYVHLGTGNYNPETATVYEDIGILSADPSLGADVTELFNALTGYSRQRNWRRLLVAPISLRQEMIELIRAEAANPDGRVVMKLNSLVDPEVIDALYEASQAGTEIDLIVRGLCSLRPGIRVLSERIRVRSLVGRFLEHSRIYSFGTEARGVKYYVGSADMMPRNLDRRVEVVAPVSDPELQERLAEILRLNLDDDVLAWELHADGEWTKVPTTSGLNTQARLMELAAARAKAPVRINGG
jgi:polyphosphate kinase